MGNKQATEDAPAIAPGLDDQMRALQSRIRKASNRRQAPRAPFPWFSIVFTFIVFGGGALLYFDVQDTAARYGSYETAAKHYGAVAGCEVAKELDLAPAAEGSAGYWRHLDGDDDGVSCEAGDKGIFSN